MTQHRLCWQNKKTGAVNRGDWRPTDVDVKRMATNANAADGVLHYWVESQETK